MERDGKTEEHKDISLAETEKKAGFENNEENEELQNRKRWLGIVLVIAGLYFCSSGMSGAVMPLRQSGSAAVDGVVIFSGIIGILGVLMIIIGGVIFSRYRRN